MTVILAFTIITYASSLILIFPLLTGSINIKETYQSSVKVVFYYCLLYAVLEVIAWVYALNSWKNHFLSNTITYTDVIFWGYYFYLIIKNKKQKKVVLILMGLTILFILWSHFGRDYNRIDSFAVSISNIYMILIALMFFFQLLNSLEVDNLFTYSHFWIAIAVLIYSSGVFFMDVFAEYIAFSKNYSIQRHWDIKYYALFFHRIFLGIGLWYSKELVENKTVTK